MNTNARKSRSTLERYCAWLAYDRHCAASGIFMSLNQMEIDHIVPISIGGADDWTNLVPVRKEVNQAKGHMNYSDEKRDELIVKAEIKWPILKELLKKTTSIPEGVASNIDLYKVEISELLADLGPTSNWNMNDIKVLITFYLRHGITFLKLLAEKLGKTIQAIRAKLVSIGIYDKKFAGQR